MSGFGGESQRNMLTDMVKFPGYAQMFTERTWSRDKERPKVWNAPQAQTAVEYEPDLADVSFELDQFAASLERAAGGFTRDLHDRRFARHRVDHHAAGRRQPRLSARRGLRHGARPRAQEGVRRDRGLGPPVADRRARPRHGAPVHVPGPPARRVPGAGGAAHQGAQRGRRRHPGGEGPAPRLLRQLGRPPHRRLRPRAAAAACSTRPGSARSASPAPTRAISTSGRSSRPTRRPRP